MNHDWTVTTAAAADARAQEFLVPMLDGIGLATDVYLPAASSPVPTVLIRLPYDKSARFTFLPSIAGRLTERGFAAVVQDVRGKFRSSGDREPFIKESSDGAATLDWIAEQTWSNGIVGMMGDSYYGFTQWAAASTGHPALRAIIPRVTGSEFFRMFGPDKVRKGPLYEWVVETFSEQGQIESPNFGRGSNGTFWIPADRPDITETIATLETRVATNEMQHLAFPNGTPAPKLAIPALHMGGWWDNLQQFQIDDWRAAQDSPAAAHQFLRMGATDHEDFHIHEDNELHRNHETDDETLVEYLDQMMADPLDFLDHYLSEAPGPWGAPRVRYELTNAGWRTAGEWAPLGTIERTLYLNDLDDATASTAGGTLAAAGPANTTTTHWRHDPRNPVPSLIASEWGQCADLPDESSIHDRSDVATFTLDPLDETLDLVGQVELELTVLAPQPINIIARLLDVYPTGRARMILEGAATAQPNGDKTRIHVRLGDTAYRLRPGHTLRLAIAASCFPLYPVHPRTVTDSPGRDNRMTVQIASTPAAPAFLRLQVATDPPESSTARSLLRDAGAHMDF